MCIRKTVNSLEKENYQNKQVTREKTFGPFNSCKKKRINLKGKTRGVLSIFVRRACAVFQGIVFDYFFWSGLSKKVILLQPVVKTRQKGNFVRSGYFLV